MKEPTSAEEVLALHKIRYTDPLRYIQIANEWIQDNPQSSHAYYGRHIAWMNLGRPQNALDDLDKVIKLEPAPISYRSRGEVYRHLGEHKKALDDFARGEAMDPAQWDEIGFGLLYQADCYARLGDEPAALAHCARLPDDFWTPGIEGTPAGGKTEIADRLRVIAAEASRKPL